MEIDLGNGYLAVIDDEDADLVTGFKWYAMKVEGKVYAAGWKHMPPGRFFVHLHRLITNAQPGEIIDHADRDTLNCRRSNLRRATRQQNNCNRGASRRGTTSKYKGVFLCRQTGRFRAQITINRKRIYLGYFDSEENAARAYNAKAVELFGEFAYLNPVDGPPPVRFRDPQRSQLYSGPRGGSSRFKGVSWNSRQRTWQVAFRALGKYHFVGNFTDEEEAARAYDRRIRELGCGTFARLNFPEEGEEATKLGAAEERSTLGL
jgi:hypothetical protein